VGGRLLIVGEVVDWLKEWGSWNYFEYVEHLCDVVKVINETINTRRPLLYKISFKFIKEEGG
jgi:hypothetical protein